MARWNEANTSWQLFRTVAGVSTQRGGSVAGSFAVGDSHTLRLTVQGTTLTLAVDGVVIASQSDSTIAATGFGGVYLGTAQSESTGIHIDSIVAGT
jgi:hypothetical protein